MTFNSLLFLLIWACEEHITPNDTYIGWRTAFRLTRVVEARHFKNNIKNHQFNLKNWILWLHFMGVLVIEEATVFSSFSWNLELFFDIKWLFQTVFTIAKTSNVEKLLFGQFVDHWFQFFVRIVNFVVSRTYFVFLVKFEEVDFWWCFWQLNLCFKAGFGWQNNFN